MLQEQNGNHLSLQPMFQQEVGLVHVQRHQQVLPKLVKEIKSKKWKEMETLILLQCMVDGGHFCKGKQGAMHWDLIAKEINAKNIGGPLRSKEQCQNRFDTLLKAYKDLKAYCEKVGKGFGNVNADEKRALKLATPLGEKNEVWYNHLHTIYVQRSSLRGESHKRQKLNLGGAIDVKKRVSSPIHSSLQSLPPLHPIGVSKLVNSSWRQVVLEEFNALDMELKYTFLNLIQVCSFTRRLRTEYGLFSLEFYCRILGIVQDEKPLHIRYQVYELHGLKLFTFARVYTDEGFFSDSWVDKNNLDISNFKVYKKFGRKVLKKNPHLNTFFKLSQSFVLATKPCPLQQIRVLDLYKCQELENVDLGNFPNLRYLNVTDCPKLKVVDGWESVKRLGWIEICNCPSYCYLPNVQFLSSLKEFYFKSNKGQRIPWQLANFNQCVQLQSLEIL